MLLAITAILALTSVASAPESKDEEKDKKSFDPFSEQEDQEQLPEGDDEVVVKPVEQTPNLAPPEEDHRARVLVLMLPDHAGAASTAHRIGAEATRRLAQQKGMSAQSLEEAVTPNAKKRRTADLHTALEEARKGMVAFEELDLEKAGADLESSMNTLLAYSDDLDADARRTLEQAIFCSGATTLFEGQTSLAESIFVALLVLNPQYEPDTELYPSNVVTRFNDLKAKVETRPTGGLTVNTNPAGGDVYVDGTFRGGSPLEINGLADGEHIVVVRRIGFKPFGTLAPVTVERHASIDVDLEAEDDAELAQELDVSLARNMSAALAFGKKIGVSKLAVLSFAPRISGAIAEGLWLDVDEGKLISNIAELSVLEDADQASNAIVEAIMQAERGPVVAVEKPEEEGGPITDRWWFWAITGAVAAVAVGATTAAIVSSASDNDTRPPPGGIILGF